MITYAFQITLKPALYQNQRVMLSLIDNSEHATINSYCIEWNTSHHQYQCYLRSFPLLDENTGNGEVQVGSAYMLPL